MIPLKGRRGIDNLTRFFECVTLEEGYDVVESCWIITKKFCPRMDGKKYEPIPQLWILEQQQLGIKRRARDFVSLCRNYRCTNPWHIKKITDTRAKVTNNGRRWPLEFPEIRNRDGLLLYFAQGGRIRVKGDVDAVLAQEQTLKEYQASIRAARAGSDLVQTGQGETEEGTGREPEGAGHREGSEAQETET